MYVAFLGLLLILFCTIGSCLATKCKISKTLPLFVDSQCSILLATEKESLSNSFYVMPIFFDLIIPSITMLLLNQCSLVQIKFVLVPGEHSLFVRVAVGMACKNALFPSCMFQSLKPMVVNVFSGLLLGAPSESNKR